MGSTRAAADFCKSQIFEEFDKSEQIIFWWRFCGTFKGVPAF